MIKFIDGGEVKVDRVTSLLYGAPGVGKTTIALTSSKPLLIDFDRGVHRAANRAGKAVVQPEKFQEVESISDEELENFDTIVVDTVGKCLDAIANDIVPGGNLASMGFGKGWALLRSRFTNWMSSLASRRNVVLVAHLSEEAKGEITTDRIVATGASRQIVYQTSDLIGRIEISDGRRFILFNPTQSSLGKSPAYFSSEARLVQDPAIDPNFMEAVLNEAISAMNVEAENCQDEHQRMEDVRNSFENMKTIEEFNEMIGVMIENDAPGSDRKILVDVAAKAGFKWDKQERSFSAID